MKPDLFTEARTGQLFPIKVNSASENDFAFIPDPLPPNWVFPAELWPKLKDAHTALARLDGIGRTLPDAQLLLAPLRHREAIASSRLEGTYATAQELMLFELNPRESKSEADQVNSWREVSNYTAALLEGADKLSETPFCLRLIKELHQTLLGGVRGRHARPGEFRQHQVAIGSDRRFIPPSAQHIEKCLSDLEAYINSENSTYDPLVRAFLVHYQFEAIHPFYDGNGRIGRVVLSLMIAKWCSLTMPWLYLSAFFEQFKDEYIKNMFQVSTEGAWGNWIDFCLTATIRQAKDSIKRCEQLNSLKSEMLNRVKHPTPRTHTTIIKLFSNPFVRIGGLARSLSVTYPTAKDDIERLVEAKILEPVQNIRPMSYYSPEIFSIAYGQEGELEI
jgi:Fic family protein